MSNSDNKDKSFSIDDLINEITTSSADDNDELELDIEYEDDDELELEIEEDEDETLELEMEDDEDETLELEMEDDTLEEPLQETHDVRLAQALQNFDNGTTLDEDISEDMEIFENIDHSSEADSDDTSEVVEDRELKALRNFRKKNPADSALGYIKNMYDKNTKVLTIYATNIIKTSSNISNQVSRKKRFTKETNVPSIPSAILSKLIVYVNGYLDDNIKDIETIQTTLADHILGLNLFRIDSNLMTSLTKSQQERVRRINKGKPANQWCAQLTDVVDSEIIFSEIADYFSNYAKCKAEDAQTAWANGGRVSSLVSVYKNRYNYVADFVKDRSLTTEDLRFTYVEKINVNSKTYVCGECGKEVEQVIPFFYVQILPTKIAGENTDTFTILNVPTVNTCPHCKALNILSEKEIERLKRAFRRAHGRDELNRFKTRCLELCEGFSLTTYEFSNLDLAELLPNVYDIVEEPDVQIEDMDELVDYTDALARYREMIEYFRNSVTSKIVSEDFEREIKVSDAFGKITGEQVHSTYVEKAEEINRRQNLSMLTKIITGILGRKYVDMKHDAVHSLISYLGEGALYNKLSYRNNKILEGIILSKDITKYLATLSEADKVLICGRICDALSISTKHIISDDKIIKDKYDEFITLVNNKFDKLIEENKQNVKNTEKLIENLHQLKKLYSFVPITKPNYIDSEVFENLCYDERIISFIDETADLMILNNLSVDFMKLWKTRTSVKSLINKVTDITNDKLEIARGLNDLLTKLETSWLDSKDVPKKNRNVAGGLPKYVGNFLVKAKIDTNDLYKLSSLKDNLTSYDEFKLRNSIVNCEFILDEKFDSPILQPLRNLIKENIAECTAFVEKYGSSDLDRFKFLFREQFTSQEIEEGYSDLLSKLKVSKILKRKPGETFEQYIERYDEVDWYKLDLDEYEHVNLDYYSKLADKLVVIYTCPLLYVSFNTMARDLATFVFASDLFYNIINEGIEKILYCFNIELELANKLLSTTPDYKIPRTTDYTKLELNTWLLNMIYLDDDLNSIRVDDSLSEENKVLSITSDLDALELAIPHIRKEGVDLINEYYSVGR